MSDQSISQHSALGDEERLAAFAESLAAAIEVGLPRWMRQSLERFLGHPPNDELRAQIEAAEQAAATDLMGQLHKFLDQDIDQQRTTPLTILRQAVPLVTAILEDAGVAHVNRDNDATRLHPGDWYDLTPGSYAEFGDEVQQASLYWGAAKAHIHIQRRRAAEVNRGE